MTAILGQLSFAKSLASNSFSCELRPANRWFLPKGTYQQAVRVTWTPSVRVCQPSPAQNFVLTGLTLDNAMKVVLLLIDQDWMSHALIQLKLYRLTERVTAMSVSVLSKQHQSRVAA